MLFLSKNYIFFYITTRIKKKKNINLACKNKIWRMANIFKLKGFYEIKFHKFEFTLYFYNFIYRIYIYPSISQPLKPQFFLSEIKCLESDSFNFAVQTFEK